MAKPTVFISGSSEARPLLRLVQQELFHDANVVTWMDAPFSLTQPPVAQFSQSVSAADFVVVLVDFSEAVRTRGRENLVFEIGYFIGRLGTDRVLIFNTNQDQPSLRIPSDMAGLTVLRAKSTGPERTPEVARQIAEEVRQRTRYIAQREDRTTYSCFISYSHDDEPLASKLFDDLSAIGARCWIDRHELRLGDSIPEQIDSALKATDRFLPILSARSLESHWFRTELQKALALETRRSTTILLPIRVDDWVLSASDELSLTLKNRLIADFSDWRSDAAYRTAFRTLALNLAVTAAVDKVSETEE
jgi:TIR domain/Predicted nucleotide-binding protein containing TIR-like domain